VRAVPARLLARGRPRAGRLTSSGHLVSVRAPGRWCTADRESERCPTAPPRAHTPPWVPRVVHSEVDGRCDATGSRRRLGPWSRASFRVEAPPRPGPPGPDRPRDAPPPQAGPRRAPVPAGPDGTGPDPCRDGSSGGRHRVGGSGRRALVPRAGRRRAPPPDRDGIRARSRRLRPGPPSRCRRGPRRARVVRPAARVAGRDAHGLSPALRRARPGAAVRRAGDGSVDARWPRLPGRPPHPWHPGPRGARRAGHVRRSAGAVGGEGARGPHPGARLGRGPRHGRVTAADLRDPEGLRRRIDAALGRAAA
jgi:hypothetical protein